MSKLLVISIVSALAGVVSAQPAPPSQVNPLSTWLRNAYMGNRNNIVRTAEKMPEENFGMRPGAQEDVRTFGQQVTHVARLQFPVVFASQGRKES